MIKTTNFVLLIVLIIISLITLTGYFWQQNRSQFPEELTHLPEFTLLDVEGNTRNHSEWEGKVLVINFWATWCPPCIREIPIFVKLQEQYAARDLQFLGIAINDSRQAVQDFIKEQGINYPILSGENAIYLAQSLGNDNAGLPFTVIIDRQNRIVSRHLGDMNQQETNDAILLLL